MQLFAWKREQSNMILASISRFSCNWHDVTIWLSLSRHTNYVCWIFLIRCMKSWGSKLDALVPHTWCFIESVSEILREMEEKGDTAAVSRWSWKLPLPAPLGLNSVLSEVRSKVCNSPILQFGAPPAIDLGEAKMRTASWENVNK